MDDMDPFGPFASAIRSGDLFVAQCSGRDIRIVCRGTEFGARSLSDRGYVVIQIEGYDVSDVEGRYFVLTVCDDVAKAREMTWLRDHGIPFAVGKEWSPAEIFEYLRDRGLVAGGYWSVGNVWPGGLALRWNE